MADLLATSIVVFMSCWLLFSQLPLITRLRIMHHPFKIDALMFGTLFFLFGATGRGALAATGAAVGISLYIKVYRFLFGHMRGSRYYIGLINRSAKVRKECNS